MFKIETNVYIYYTFVVVNGGNDRFTSESCYSSFISVFRIKLFAFYLKTNIGLKFSICTHNLRFHRGRLFSARHQYPIRRRCRPPPPPPPHTGKCCVPLLQRSTWRVCENRFTTFCFAGSNPAINAANPIQSFRFSFITPVRRGIPRVIPENTQVSRPRPGGLF